MSDNTTMNEFIAAWYNNDPLQLKKIETEVSEIRKQRHRERVNGLLKLCPFCRGKAEIVSRTNFEGGSQYEVKMVKCTNCGASTAAKLSEEHSDDDLAMLWNRRVKSR